jgi:hypothetical protein
LPDRGSFGQQANDRQEYFRIFPSGALDRFPSEDYSPHNPKDGFAGDYAPAQRNDGFAVFCALPMPAESLETGSRNRRSCRDLKEET